MLRRTTLQGQRWLRTLQLCEKSTPGCSWLSPCLAQNSVQQKDICLSRNYAHGLPGMAAGIENSGLTRQQKVTRVHKIADEILQLNLLELAELTELFQEKLGISNLGMQQLHGSPAPSQGAAPQVAAAEAAPEQTEFNVVLNGFDASTKIKVIKEIRALSELGLKEAKELVEKAPVTVKAGLKKEEAEELKKKLEAAGGKVSLE